MNDNAHFESETPPSVEEVRNSLRQFLQILAGRVVTRLKDEQDAALGRGADDDRCCGAEESTQAPPPHPPTD